MSRKRTYTDADREQAKRLDLEKGRLRKQRKRENPAIRQSEAETKRRKRVALKERQSDTRPEFVSQGTESKYLETVVMPEIICNLRHEDFPCVLITSDEPVTATALDVEPPPKLVDQVSVSEPVVPSSLTRLTPVLSPVPFEPFCPESSPTAADDSFLEVLSVDLDFHMLDEEEYIKRFEVTALGSLMKQFSKMEGALQWNCTTFTSMSIEKLEEKYRQAKRYAFMHMDLEPIYRTATLFSAGTHFLVHYLFPIGISKTVYNTILHTIFNMGNQSSSMYEFVAGNPDNKIQLPNLIMKCFFSMAKIVTIIVGERIAQR